MNHVLYFLISLMIFSIVGLGELFLASRTSRATMLRVCEVTRSRRVADGAGPRRKELGQQLFSLLHWIRVRMGIVEDSDLRARMIRAGYRSSGPVDLYIAARVLGPLCAVALGSLIPLHRMFCMIALPALAYIAPAIILERLVKRRREKIRKSIPDAIDLLVICVDAGLGIDQALLRVSQELGVTHPDITGELLQVNRQQRAGKPRIEAWQEMAERSGLAELTAFANMLLQTERFGTPVARALSAFSDAIRQKRRQAAEEIAAKTTVKIIFPLVLFIFPSMFIVLLGPAAIAIMRGMSGMVQ